MLFIRQKLHFGAFRLLDNIPDPNLFLIASDLNSPCQFKQTCGCGTVIDKGRSRFVPSFGYQNGKVK